MAKSKTKHKRAPKSVLKLLDLEQSKSAVLNSLTSPSSQRTYDHAIREFIEVVLFRTETRLQQDCGYPLSDLSRTAALCIHDH